MRLRILLAPIAFAAIACSSPSAPAVSEVPVDAIAIVPDDFSEAIQGLRYFSGYGERARRVIKDRETWTRVWLRATTTASSRPLPAVDFDQNMILFAAMGWQRSSGYEIELVQVYRRANDIYAVVRESSPGNGCAVAWGSTAPVTAALVPRISGRVYFVERAGVRHCR